MLQLQSVIEDSCLLDQIPRQYMFIGHPMLQRVGNKFGVMRLLWSSLWCSQCHYCKHTHRTDVVSSLVKLSAGSFAQLKNTLLDIKPDA